MQMMTSADGLTDDQTGGITGNKPLSRRDSQLADRWGLRGVGPDIGTERLSPHEDAATGGGLFLGGSADDAGRVNDGVELPGRQRLEGIDPQVRAVELRKKPIVRRARAAGGNQAQSDEQPGQRH